MRFITANDDVILCQITSKTISDSYAVPLASADFKTGTLHQDSNVRPNRLFTADLNIILYRAGELTPSKITGLWQIALSTPDMAARSGA